MFRDGNIDFIQRLTRVYIRSPQDRGGRLRNRRSIHLARTARKHGLAPSTAASSNLHHPPSVFAVIYSLAVSA